MKINKFIFLPLGLLLGLGMVLYFIWPRNHVEIQLRDTKSSPDGQWVAVVQLEVRNAGWVVNDAVYAVRLKKAGQKNVEGDLVMNVPVSHPAPEPSISWRDNTLLIGLAKEQNYQYFVNSVDGIAVVLQRDN
jgi:hypothetical protein